MTDTVTGSITGSQSGITVNPAAASTFVVTGFTSPVTAGTSGMFSVTAKDPYNNTATGYVGTVHFTSSDGQAALPANYTFTSGDSGVHTFSGTLKTAGTESITATDTVTSSITGSQTGITVNAGASRIGSKRLPLSRDGGHGKYFHGEGGGCLRQYGHELSRRRHLYEH